MAEPQGHPAADHAASRRRSRSRARCAWSPRRSCGARRTAIESARPYADRMRDTLVGGGGAARARAPSIRCSRARDAVRKVDFVVVTSDRGLCGAFNANVLKRAEAEIAARSAERRVDRPRRWSGRKAVEFFRAPTSAADRSERVTGIARVEYGHAAGDRRDREPSASSPARSTRWCSSTASSSARSRRRPRVVQLLPLAPERRPRVPSDGSRPSRSSPTPSRCWSVLVPKALEVEIYRALLENQAGEHAARMTAMESATRNTEEMIESAHAPVQPRTAGGDHQGAGRDRVGRARAAANSRAPEIREHSSAMDAATDIAGKIVQVMGPVVDVEFPPGELPEVYTALRLTNPAIDDAREQPRGRGRAAPRREHRALHRDGHDRRPRPRPAGARTRATASGAGRARRRSAAS